MQKLGLANNKVSRTPIKIFVLDDDALRHKWFQKRFKNDEIDIAEDVAGAKEFLTENTYDAIFLDHDLLPEHYEKQEEHDDDRTGFAVAQWLSANPKISPAAKITVHTRNDHAAMRMIEKLRESKRNVEYIPFPMLEYRINDFWI